MSVPILLRVCSVGYTGTRGIFGGRTELTEVSGTGIEVGPYLLKCRIPVSSSYRTIPECSVEYRAWHRKNTGTPGIVVEGIPGPGAYLGGRTELTQV